MLVGILLPPGNRFVKALLESVAGTFWEEDRVATGWQVVAANIRIQVFYPFKIGARCLRDESDRRPLVTSDNDFVKFP